MKVIQLFFPGPMGGAEKVLLSGVKALQDNGFETEIWVVQENRVPYCADDFLTEANELGLKTKAFTCYSVFDRKLKKGLTKKLLAEKPDIVHAHGFKAALYGHLCTPKMARLIITHHGITSHTLKVKIYEAIEKWTMKKAFKVIAVSEMMRIDLERRGVPASKIRVVENLLSMEVRPREIPRNKELNLVYVGRLSLEKGVHTLLLALSKLPKLIPFKLVVVGDGREKEKLILQAKELGIESSVEFVGFQRDVKKFLIPADALAIPSLREGLPMTLIEACCMGLPIIGSRVGGIPLLVEDKKNGILFKSEDADDLKKCLAELDDDKNQYLNRAKEMSSSFLKRYSPHKWAENTLEVYKSCLSQV
ncbi:MAG: glycosyltransferase involved in cell wall biosynthesis [Bacteriovoracaceae bacterium]|jgi:glycosyltransferase involved in cell wall biosynthesis